MISFRVTIDNFFSQVQCKRNPQWKNADLVVLFKDRILCSTEGPERRGMMRGRVIDISDISPDGETLSIGKFQSKCIRHSEICRPAFKPYWNASRNIFNLLSSLTSYVKQICLDEFIVAFADEFSEGENGDSITDHILELITEIGYFASTEIYDESSQKSSASEGLPSALGVRDAVDSGGNIIASIRFLNEAEAFTALNEPLACFHEYTKIISGAHTYAHALSDHFLNEHCFDFMELMWNHCRLVLSNHDPSESFRLADMRLELEGLKAGISNFNLRGISQDPFLFSFHTDIMPVEIDQAAELFRMLVRHTKDYYSSDDLNRPAKRLNFCLNFVTNGLSVQEASVKQSLHHNYCNSREVEHFIQCSNSVDAIVDDKKSKKRQLTDILEYETSDLYAVIQASSGSDWKSAANISSTSSHAEPRRTVAASSSKVEAVDHLRLSHATSQSDCTNMLFSEVLIKILNHPGFLESIKKEK